MELQRRRQGIVTDNHPPTAFSRLIQLLHYESLKEAVFMLIQDLADANGRGPGSDVYVAPGVCIVEVTHHV